jgi:hypothetical protein
MRDGFCHIRKSKACTQLEQKMGLQQRRTLLPVIKHSLLPREPPTAALLRNNACDAAVGCLVCLQQLSREHEMHMHAYPQDTRRSVLQLLQASAAHTTPVHRLLLSGLCTSGGFPTARALHAS